jgi:hypothetical protein
LQSSPACMGISVVRRTIARWGKSPNGFTIRAPDGARRQGSQARRRATDGAIRVGFGEIGHGQADMDKRRKQGG